MTIVEEVPATAHMSGDGAAARKAMIDSQLRTSGVNAEFVLRRMAAVPREDFLPASARALAYTDRAVPLGEGRSLAAPVVQGLMLQEAAPNAQDKVLLVDGGSGYLAELVRPLVASLETLDAAAALAESRKKGDCTLLLIDGAIEQVPAGLARRVAEGGRIVTGLVERGLTRLASGRKLGGEVMLLPLVDVGIPVLAEFNAPKGWSF